MSTIRNSLFQFSYLVACLLATFPASAWSQGTGRWENHKFLVQISSTSVTQVEGKEQNIKAETELCYTWRRRGSQRELIFHSIHVDVSGDGIDALNSRMSAEKLVVFERGEKIELPVEEAPADLKRMLQDSFEVPLCNLMLDNDGRILTRKVLARPDGQDFVKDGNLANALIFHPPFPSDQDRWQSRTEFSIGSGGFVRGDLNYKTAAVRANEQDVDVSGTLTLKSYPKPNTPLTIENVRYLVSGQQTYETNRQVWDAGKLTVDLSYQLSMNNEKLASAKGTMNLTFKRLPSED